MGRLSQKKYEQHDGKAAPTSAAPAKGRGEERIYQQTISERSDNVPEGPATVVKAQDVIDMMQDSKSAAQQHEPLAAGQGTVEADCHNPTHSQNVAYVNICGKNREAIPLRWCDCYTPLREHDKQQIGKRDP
jgi:hypothetical protein